ncbi:MAG: zinc ribbon domain-containing protein [Clostridia bacterium]|nr:zinc ribbon domain-containing protein [Clostridia bacterium]
MLLILSLFAFAVLSIVTTILIGVWIYRDAKKRDMDAVLWTLLAILLPSFIGVIVYFASRSKEKLYVCPRCGGSVKEDYVHCPTCALQFKRKCTSCGLTCDEKWRKCPRCSNELDPIAYPLAKPFEKKDHLIRNIVLLIVANIVMFFGVFIGSFVTLFNNPDFVEEFQVPYIEEFDEFGIYAGKFDVDLR